jgi:hypothetical protein
MPGCSSPSTSRPSAAFGAAALILLAGCAGSGAIPAPTAKNVELAGRNGQVTTLQTLKVGRSLYIGRCGACHSLKEPGYLVPADWPEMVERMADNAKINGDQQRAITQYLVSVSAAVHDSAAAPASAAVPADPAAKP